MGDEVIALFLKYGSNDYIGENVTQLEHMTQCALLAKKDGATDNLIVAALLHDIGHLLVFDSNTPTMPGLGVAGHEDIGAKFLESLGFNSTVCTLVRNHVAAKRYLISTNSTYYDHLSNASKQTLEYQGGVITPH